MRILVLRVGSFAVEINREELRADILSQIEKGNVLVLPPGVMYEVLEFDEVKHKSENTIENMIFKCEICGNTDACERTDIENEPVLCDDCYTKKKYEQCARCKKGASIGAEWVCLAKTCEPEYKAQMPEEEKNDGSE